jgi:hypothetical protein
MAKPPPPGPEPRQYNMNLPHMGTTSEWEAWKRRKTAYDNYKPPVTQDRFERSKKPPGKDMVERGRLPGNPNSVLPVGGGTGGNPIGTVPAKPSTPKTSARVQTGKGLKVATRELFLTQDTTVGEITATQRIFQEIAGIELLSISRNYSVNGITQLYNPIANISDLSDRYSPFNIIPLQGIDTAYFNQYPIDLSVRLPDFPNNPDGSTHNVYMDNSNTIVIELADFTANERVEIEFLSSDDQVGWYN